MESFIQGFIMSFREGLEAFLIIAILLKFLEKARKEELKINVFRGLFTGVLFSFCLGAILMAISGFLGGLESASKMWESIVSLIAVILVTTFIIWMIQHGTKLKSHVEKKASLSLSKKGIFLLSFFMVVREGVEIVLFQFAGKYSILSVTAGIFSSIILVYLIYHSLVKVNLSTIFSVTLAYLILQAGFLLGYSLHEGLSAAKELKMIEPSSPVFIKAFDLSKTVFDHKEGPVGITLYVAAGWYSRPEWVQFIIQYGYSLILFIYWYKYRKSDKSHTPN